MSEPEYTLGFVQRDGNMHDRRHFGPDLDCALIWLAQERKHSNPHHIHWYVYDAEDEERGYFEP